MKKNYKYKFRVGSKTYLTNSWADIDTWLKGTAFKRWKGYAYDFEGQKMLVTLNGKIYERKFGSKKLRIMKDQYGKIWHQGY